MISFSPDGFFQTKINIFSCEKSLKGAFIKCSYEAGREYILMTQVIMKIAKNLTLMIKPKMTPVKCHWRKWSQNRVSYGCSESRILCRFLFVAGFIWNVFLCYANDVGKAPEMMVDYYNHTIEKRSMYLKCNCLQQKSEKKEMFDTVF